MGRGVGSEVVMDQWVMCVIVFWGPRTYLAEIAVELAREAEGAGGAADGRCND